MTKSFKLVDLAFNGDLINSGFDVSLTIYNAVCSLDGALEHRSFVKRTHGQLPARPELSIALDQWRDSYRRLGSLNRGIVAEGLEIGGQFNDCRNAAEQLRHCFSNWLNSLEFRVIEISLRDYCTRHDQIQILLEIQNQDDHNHLRHLPWHLWSFVHGREYVEVAFQPHTTQPPTLQRTHPRPNLKVLAILGYSKGLNVAQDIELLKDLADVTVLQEPNSTDINDRLWNQAWDILFFAGHSDSQAGLGRLYLNQHGNYLTIAELKSGLAMAIRQGLRLAVFNSCDGLGLAYQLEQLYFPQMIVMREPIPDQIAHKFLMYFVQALQNTTSVYMAMRVTRERLSGLDKMFPCASWLPVLFHNPATPAFKWPIKKRQQVVRWQWQYFLQALVVACLVLFLVIGLRFFGFLQALELKSYDQMMRLRPDHLGVDNRVLVITIDQEDIAYQRSQGIKGEGSLSDQALLQILQKVEPYNTRVVASDVIHDFAYSSELSAYLEKTDNFMGLCVIKVEESHLVTIEPPPGLPVEQLGFVNFPLDPDGKVRRQFLEMQPDTVCTTKASLSFAIASYYLKHHDPTLVPEYLDDNHLRLGKVIFQKFNQHAGGYALPPQDAGGFQVLINYRSKPPPTISLREFLVLGEAQLKSIASERMILIGVANGKSDQHRTPYDSDSLSSTAGVMVHAQMTSHLVSAALGEDSTIRWWPGWLENLWLLYWSLWSALITRVLQGRKPRSFICQGLMIVGTSGLLFAIGWLGLVNGVWIPLIPAWFTLVLSALSFAKPRPKCL